MPWGIIGGLAAGALMGAAQGGISYASAKQQQDATRQAYQHRYQWTMDDMRKAGLNPLLAAQHGAGSVGSMSQMETPNLAATAQALSQINMQDAQAEQARAQAGQAEANTALATAQEMKTAQEAHAQGMENQMTSYALNYMSPGTRKDMSTTERLFGLGRLMNAAGLPASSLAGPAASAYGSTVNALGNLGAAGLLKKLGGVRGVIKGFAQ